MAGGSRKPAARKLTASGIASARSAEEERRLHGARARDLADALVGLLDEDVHLTITDNTSTMVSFRRDRGLLRLRAHRIFLEAPREVVQALARYVRGNKEAGRTLDAYVRAHADQIRRIRAERHAAGLEPRGLFFDLQLIFDELNREFFGSRIEARIGWGRSGPRRRTRSIRMGVYLHDSRVIRVHPALDRPDVPLFFVRYVVFHEMLHQAFPPREVDGKTIVHTPEFRAAERAYPDYERAIAWERANIHRLLRRPTGWTFDLDDPLA